MQYILAASLVAIVPTVLATGSAHVVNNCGTDVYYASVQQGVASPFQLLPSGGYSEGYSLANVGISIKLSPESSGANPTQFEFTWASGNINYDISNINGNPFSSGGMSLVPSAVGASGYPTCVAVDCPAGQSTCTAAYNQPDDTATKVCPDSSDLTFTLCPGGASSGTSTNSGSASTVSSAAPTKTVATANSQSSPAATSAAASAAQPSHTWAGHHHKRDEAHLPAHRVHARHMLRR